MAGKRHGVIHFTDGTKIGLKFPKQAGDDPVTIMKNVSGRSRPTGSWARWRGSEGVLRNVQLVE